MEGELSQSFPYRYHSSIDENSLRLLQVTKVLNFELVPSPAGSIIPYQVLITDKHVLTEDEKKTQEYDRLAFRYVSYVAAPLLVGYTIYSLMYESHKGWYSFTIRTLTSFVYTFGFVSAPPSTFIIEKLSDSLRGNS